MSTASDNTAKWAVRKFGGAGLPVGFEYFTTNPNIPAGSLPLLGGVYSRTLYKDLWNWVQEQAGYLIEESEWQEKSAANEGNVPFYSTGDGVSTFRVPSLKCWVKGANGIEEVGSYLSAGLPNIKGSFNVNAAEGGYRLEVSTYEAFYRKIDSRGRKVTDAGAATSYDGSSAFPGFDASRYNSIYGNSDTVQPKSIVGMWLVKAYGTVTNNGNINIDNILRGLTELENRVTPIDKGGTGANNASDACANLGLATVASTGNYSDLSNKPTIPSAYTHPTTSGNKHIPSGGSSGQILRWSADGTAVWGADNNTTYSTATQSANGLMSASDKKKLDGIASGVSSKAYITETSISNTSWYRKWSDGWIEQGLVVAGANRATNFLKAFSNTNYTVAVSLYNTTTSAAAGMDVVSCVKTTTTVKFGTYTDWGSVKFMVYACGK